MVPSVLADVDADASLSTVQAAFQALKQENLALESLLKDTRNAHAVREESLRTELDAARAGFQQTRTELQGNDLIFNAGTDKGRVGKQLDC